MPDLGPQKELVNQEQVLAGAVPEGKALLERPRLTRLRPLERAGLQLALGVGLAIGVVTLIVAFDWFRTRPPMPHLSGTLAEQAQTIENFKALNDVALERATKIFDLIVVKAFLPVFTGILGYIFGSRSEKVDEERRE